MGTTINKHNGDKKFTSSISSPQVTDKIGSQKVPTNGGVNLYKFDSQTSAPPAALNMSQQDYHNFLHT